MRTEQLAALLVIGGSLVGCGDKPAPSAASASAALSAAPAPLPDTPIPVSPSGEPIVQLKHVSRRGLKGTEVELQFDVTLINDRAEPRWFFVPSTLERPKWIGAVKSLQVTELRGDEGTLVIGRGQYFEGSFQVVLLGPGAKATIRGLFTSIFTGFDNKSPLTKVSFEVVTATEVRMGGEPLRSRFPVDPTLTGTADVKDDRTQIGKFELEGYRTPDDKEAPVTVTIDRELRLTVPLVPVDR